MRGKRWFEGKRVLVTGASRGIGRAAGLQLAARGAAVIFSARDGERLEAAAAEARQAGGVAEVVVMDVTDPGSVAAGVGRCLEGGAVDVLVNNAGVYEQIPFLAQAPEQQAREMETNYFGALRVTRALLPAMIAAGGGTVVNVSSLVGAIPCPGVANYGATKAALNAWTHAMRGELRGHGVRMVVYMPSHTATESALASRYEGVPMLSVELAVAELLRAIRRAPRSYAASPVFRSFLRLAGLFPGWAEGRMRACTAFLFEGPPRLSAPAEATAEQGQ